MIEAAFTDGIALICVIPSKSQNGVYLVKVTPCENLLIVSHSCPSHRFGNPCSHTREAVKGFYTWRWWAEPLPIETDHQHVELDPEWDQIPVPGGMTDTVLQVIEGDPNAS